MMMGAITERGRLNADACLEIPPDRWIAPRGWG